MKVSIVSPSFNQAAFIQKTIESVACQTHIDKEHIIVDGGSTDGCAEVVTAAEQEHAHVRALIEPDRGQADAINKGLRLAAGDILTWLNTDDYYSDPDVLATVAEFFASNPEVDIAWGRGLRVDRDGHVLSSAWVQPPDTDFTMALQRSIGLLQPSVFFRRSVFETVGGLSEDWSLQLDYEYWIRIAQAGFRFGFIDRVLSHAVVHADAKSTAQRMQQLNECLRLVRDKFHYVPVEWIRQYGEFFLTRKDHKVTKDLKLDGIQLTEYAAIERALLEALNGDHNTQQMLRKRADIEPYATTYKTMRAYGIDSPQPRRIVATSFDSAYMQQGLNLIAALHRTSTDSFDEILVYPLGLRQKERERLSSLEKVTIVDYPHELTEFFPEFLNPKTRAYKPYAIQHAAENSHDGDLILWMDAGLAPLQDIDAIFNIIADQEFFITDHDDKKGWPFFNINFAHRGSHAPLELDNDDLLAPHLCSALIGYKRGGNYQDIIDKAYRLGQIREAVVWPKVPEPSTRYKAQLTADQQVLRRQLVEGVMPPQLVGYETLISMFDYYGHRTQVIYSVLAHRAGAPVFSARTFRRSNDESSQAAAVNWTETARHTDKASSRRNLNGIDATVAVYHHRGIYNNLDGMRHKRDDDALFIVGNGPSLRDFPLESLSGRAWLGMNAAYRYWSRVGLYPTYYSCLDEVVLDSHRVEIVDMITRREELGISKFFLRRGILEHHPELDDISAVYFLEDLQRDVDWFEKERITTGSFSVLAGWFLGYRDIYLLGIDLDYVERLPEAIPDGKGLTLASNPVSNPNYFFDGYQRKGDRFNPPNRHPGMHLRSWAQLRSTMQGFPIRVTNLNPNSAVREFPFARCEAEFQRLESRDQQTEAIAERAVQVSREKRYWREVTLEQVGPHQPNTRLQREMAGESDKAAPGGDRADSRSAGEATKTSIEGDSTQSESGHSGQQGWYALFGDWLKLRPPLIWRGLRFVRSSPARLWRQRVWAIPLLLLAILPVISIHPAVAGLDALLLGRIALAVMFVSVLGITVRMRQIAMNSSREVSKVNRAVASSYRDISAQIKALDHRLEGLDEEHKAMLTTAVKETEASVDRLRADFSELVETRATKITTEIEELRARLSQVESEIDRAEARAKSDNAELDAVITKLRLETDEARDGIRAEIERQDEEKSRLRDRVAASERQIGILRYPEAPSTLVFFGHHKCGSRFFRNEVFGVVVEATRARERKYEIKDPPFHYSTGDELDLCNIDFDRLGQNGRDVVLFSNATVRSLDRIRRETEDWRGLRIIRDPRQVLVSNYFHHKGNHKTEYAGWIWDQLIEDKPILRELPKEQGLLYELGSISKQIIEAQILAPFDDERVMTIKIEDFSDDPQAWLRRISQFLRVPDISGINFAHTNASSETGPWRSHFTSRLRNVFKERYGQALIDLGYADDFDW